MQGTIRRNNVLQDMVPYGCWSDTPKLRVSSFFVRNGNMKAEWPHRMTVKCRYDRKETDERCNGCQVEWDAEYVANLR